MDGVKVRAHIGLAALAALGCVDLHAPPELKICAPDRCGRADADATQADGGAADGPADAPPDLAIADSGPTGSDARAADAPGADAAAGDGPADPAAYNFEQGVQGWRLIRPAGNTTTTARTSALAFAGGSALAIDLDGPANVDAVTVAAAGADVILPPPGTVISFRIWFAADAPLQSVQPYILDIKDSAGLWTGAFTFASALQPGVWNTIRLTAPSSYNNVVELGVEWRTTAAWKGTVYVDAVGW